MKILTCLTIAALSSIAQTAPKKSTLKQNVPTPKVEIKPAAPEVRNSDFTDKRDGKVYKTIVVGNTQLFAQNLNFNSPNSKCPDNKEENCSKFGKLYTHSDAINICPEGWRIPSNEEWSEIKGKLDKLGTLGDQSWFGENKSSFSALPSGGIKNDGTSFYFNEASLIWSAKSSSITDTEGKTKNFAYYNIIVPNAAEFPYGDVSSDFYLGVRCAKFE